MIVTAWNNGNPRKSGAGYGLKVSVADRDTYFKRSWADVVIELPDGQEAAVSVAKESFWGPQCRELIGVAIGRWFLAEGLAPWPFGQPPKLDLQPLEEGRFSLRLMKD